MIKSQVVGDGNKSFEKSLSENNKTQRNEDEKYKKKVNNDL